MFGEAMDSIHGEALYRIRVAIRTVAGDCIEMDIESQKKVADIKTFIRKSWHIPEIFQTLVLGTVMLQDQDRVRDCCEADEDMLSLTMILSMSRVQRDLTSHNQERQCSALESLVELGRRAGFEPIIAVVAGLESRDTRVTRGVVKALVQLSEKGSEHAIAGVAARLEDDDWDVRRAAVEGLTKLAEKGDQRASTAVAARLGHRGRSVSGAAIEALA
eukprot:gnl/TRDRNA2_/TRDRNA2_173080_c2_seq1.p1 gnl/TRDRNA2_/TRDRNA2_173080_c2~~gnl/TRDRNA2_/TRDRNA2_173080_c2_seq1.p1  ORF type:complete len:217 (-),score=45.44 gnl/TRDRNA2_/TRDRNA2_173080_c2_seq1:164-814(-)